MKKTKMFLCLALVLVLATVLLADESSDCKPNCTPQVQSKSYPGDPIPAQTVQIALNMEPRFFWKNGQEEAAKQKLADYKKKFGKSPNILIFLMDDGGRGRCVRMFECYSKPFHTCTRRFPGSYLMGYPVQVQGNVVFLPFIFF